MRIEGEGIHLREYLRVVIKRRRAVAVFFLSTFVLVLLGTFAATPQYRGTTQVIIEKAAPDALAGGYRSARYDPEFYETQLQLIQSHLVARRVVEMLSLEETYDTYLGKYNQPSLFRTVSKWLKKQISRPLQAFASSEREVEQENQDRSKGDLIARKLRKGLTVEPVLDSRFVAISYLSPNPQFSAVVANTFAKAYLEETLDMKMESTRRTLAWMTKKAENERLKLEGSEKRIQEYMRANNLVTLENRVAVIPQQLSQVSTELVRAQTKRKQLEALYGKVKKVVNNPEAAVTIPAIAADPALQTLQSQLLKAEQNIMELSGKYGKKHPTMIKAAADLNVLQKKKANEIARIIQSIKNEYELARSAESGLRSQLNRNKAEAQRVNEKFIQYQALNREMETNRQLYDALLVKIKEQSITGENHSVVNFTVVEEASIPNHPVKPRKAVNALLGLIVGLFGGTGLAFFAEYLDNTVKDPEEAEAELGAPILGVVSVCKGNQPIAEMVLNDPRSVFAENYKAVRTALLLSSADKPPRVVLITSSAAGEGKTTTAVNLAMVLAQSEKRVLLIDGDLRKPRLHKVFKISNKKGLSTYLAGSSGGDMLSKGPLPNLAVITSGPIPPNPSELLTSGRMKALLDSLGSEFDAIICDSPPVLSVADSRILSRLVDGTMLVAQGGQTTYDMARRALKSLQGVKAHVLGVVINNLDIKKNDYYYHEYYSAYEEEQDAAVASERLERMVGDK